MSLSPLSHLDPSLCPLWHWVFGGGSYLEFRWPWVFGDGANLEFQSVLGFELFAVDLDFRWRCWSWFSVGFGCQSLSLIHLWPWVFSCGVWFWVSAEGWGDRREIGAGVGRSLASSWAASRRGGSMAAGQRISLVEKKENEQERPSESCKV